MQLLLIDGWQEIGIPALIIFFMASAFFLWKSIKGSKSGQKQQAHPGSPGVKSFSDNTPFYKVHSFKYAVGFFVMGVIILIMITSDYSSKVSKKIPQQQTDTTRQAAEDMIKPN